MYKFITCPKTGNIYTVSSKNGYKVIMGYAKFILKQSGGMVQKNEVDMTKVFKVRDSIINEILTRGYNQKYIDELLNIINKIDESGNNIDIITEYIEACVTRISLEDKLQQVTSSRHSYMTSMTQLYDNLSKNENFQENIIPQSLELKGITKVEETNDIAPVNPQLPLQNVSTDDVKPNTLTSDDYDLIARLSPIIGKNQNILIPVMEELNDVFPNMRTDLKETLLTNFLQLYLSNTTLKEPRQISYEEQKPVRRILVGGAAVGGEPNEGGDLIRSFLIFALNIYRFLSRRAEAAHDFNEWRNLNAIKDVLKKKGPRSYIGRI